MYSCTHSLTLALDGGGWLKPCPTILQEAGLGTEYLAHTGIWSLDHAASSEYL